MTKAEFQQKEEKFFDEWWNEIDEEDKAHFYVGCNDVEFDEYGCHEDIPVKELDEWWNLLKIRDKAYFCKDYMVRSEELDEDWDMDV